MIEFQFGSVAELLAMAGHGPYVWFCYGLALVMVLANWLLLRRARRLFLRDAAARLARTRSRKSQSRSHEPMPGSS